MAKIKTPDSGSGSGPSTSKVVIKKEKDPQPSTSKASAKPASREHKPKPTIAKRSEMNADRLVVGKFGGPGSRGATMVLRNNGRLDWNSRGMTPNQSIANRMCLKNAAHSIE